MSVPPRCSPRIRPPSPVTVAFEDDRGSAVAYGVMTDISRRGGCIRTDVLIVRDATFTLRLSFAYPPEVHTLVGKIVWARADPEASLSAAYCCGVEWISLGYTLRCRLRQLTSEAARPGDERRFILDKKWAVNDARTPPGSTAPSPGGNTPWNPSGPQTRPFAVRRPAHAAVGSASGDAREGAGILRFPRQRVREENH